MTDNTYNGWTNYATWRVALEIFDGFNPIEDWGLERETLTESELAELLQEHAEEVVFEGSTQRNIADSYAEAFLSEVNWYEIARQKLEEDAA
jgi:hypothetical protein